jgi:hypothetical protein
MSGDSGASAPSDPSVPETVDNVLLDAMSQPRARALLLKIEGAISKFMSAPRYPSIHSTLQLKLTDNAGQKTSIFLG